MELTLYNHHVSVQKHGNIIHCGTARYLKKYYGKNTVILYLLEMDTVVNHGIVKYLKDYHCTTIKHGKIW